MLAFMFLGTTVAPVLWFACVKDKFDFENYDFLIERHFIAGVFASLGIILWILVGIVGTLRIFEGFYGKEIESLRLLIQKLEKESGDNKPADAQA